MCNSELYHYGVKGMHWGVRRYQNPDGTYTNAGKRHRNDDTRTSKIMSDNLKKGAIIAVSVLALYGAHKVINNPAILKVGKAFVDKSLKVSGKLSKNISSSAEYKIAKATAEGVVTVGKGVARASNTIVNSKTAKAITGIGAMATTTQVLRTQIKELREIQTQNDDDGVNKALNEIKKMSEIGESAVKIAKGPFEQNNKSFKQPGTDSNLLVKTRNLKSEIGDPQGMHGAEDEKRYQQLFQKNPTDDQRAWIKAMRKNGYSVDQIEAYIFHSLYRNVKDFYPRTNSNELYHGVNGTCWRVKRW